MCLQTKREVLRNAKKLRNSSSDLLKKVYINPDLTVKQKEADKLLREEMWTRRGNGENVAIHRNKIITVEHNVRKTRSPRNQQPENKTVEEEANTSSENQAVLPKTVGSNGTQ